MTMLVFLCAELTEAWGGGEGGPATSFGSAEAGAGSSRPLLVGSEQLRGALETVAVVASPSRQRPPHGNRNW